MLDDLPAMDDAELRRGRPTTHRAHSARRSPCSPPSPCSTAPTRWSRRAPSGCASRATRPEDLVHHLAEAIGTRGLIGGQALDLESRPGQLDLERLEYIHSHKTGALFLAAAELGAMAADARRADLEAVSRFAKNLGLAFQIEDDLLDVLATSDETGKDAGQDAGKVTFVTPARGRRGPRARRRAARLRDRVARALRRRADALRALVELVRDHGRHGNRGSPVSQTSQNRRAADE